MIRCATNNVRISQVSRRFAKGHEPEPAMVVNDINLNLGLASQGLPPEKNLHQTYPATTGDPGTAPNPLRSRELEAGPGEFACDQKLCVIAGAITLYNAALCRVCSGSWNCVLCTK